MHHKLHAGTHQKLPRLSVYTTTLGAMVCEHSLSLANSNNYNNNIYNNNNNNNKLIIIKTESESG